MSRSRTKAGVGAAIISWLSAGPHRLGLRLKRLAKVSPRVVGIAWHRDRCRLPAADAFIRLTQAAAETSSRPRASSTGDRAGQRHGASHPVRSGHILGPNGPYREPRSGQQQERHDMLWRQRRDELFLSHPQSPLPPGVRAGERL